jgi:membrane-associated phospholipid phosphatase
MIEQFFKAISYVFHPLLMPLLGVYFLFESPTIPASFYKLDALYFFPDAAKNRIYLVLAVLTFAAPLLSLAIMYWNKMISSFHLEKKEERVYPFFIVSFYYVLAYIFVAYQWPKELQHPAFVGFLFGTVLVFLITFILNFWTKISIHAVAIFGILGLLVAYNQTQLTFYEEEIVPNLWLILFFAVLSGLVVTARLYLKAHTLKEVLQGMAIGFAGIYFCVRFGIYI